MLLFFVNIWLIWWSIFLSKVFKIVIFLRHNLIMNLWYFDLMTFQFIFINLSMTYDGVVYHWIILIKSVEITKLLTNLIIVLLFVLYLLLDLLVIIECISDHILWTYLLMTWVNRVINWILLFKGRELLCFILILLAAYLL